MTITKTKKKMSLLCQSAATILDLVDGSAVITPHLKNCKASPNNVLALTPKEKKQIIRDTIRLPRPQAQGGNIVYSVAEAVGVDSVLVG